MHADDQSMLLTDKEYHQMKKDKKKLVDLHEILPLNAFNTKPVTEIKYFSKCMQLSEIKAGIIDRKAMKKSSISQDSHLSSEFCES